MEEALLKQVGRYDLLEVIGRGGAAVVYLARQTDLQRYVALKELAPFHAADQTFAQRFVEEGRLAGAMNHANIVTVHEFFETTGVPYIAMEYLPHGSLRRYIDKLSLGQIAGVLEGVLAGLSHGASRQVVHRDLKPENLLVAVDGRVKIADFGVARAFNNAATRDVVTVTGTTIGTPAYMSPEQALGAEVTPACDLYSLGVVAWELFAGHTPFEQTETPVAVLYRHVHEEIAPLRSVAPDTDERIERWVARLLAKDPTDRYPSADEAWWALEDIVLDLLGPRWRRDARLTVDDTPTVERAPLTPAPFTDSAPEAEPTPESTPPRRDTVEPVRAIPETVSGMETVAPTTAPKPSYTTILRPARRHREVADSDGATARDPWRRRLGALAIVLAMAGAAVAGVLIAGGGSSGPSTAAQRTAQQAAVHAEASTIARRQSEIATAGNGAVASVIRDFAPRRIRDVTRLVNAHTQKAQIAGATTVQKDYDAAARSVGGYAAQTPKAAPLQKTLRSVGSDYGTFASSVATEDGSRFAAAKRAISAGEKTLQRQVDGL